MYLKADRCPSILFWLNHNGIFNDWNDAAASLNADKFFPFGIMDVVAVFHAQAVAVGKVFFPKDDAFDVIDVFGIRFGGEFGFNADIGLGR